MADEASDIDPAAIADPDLKECEGSEIRDHFLMRLKEDVRQDIAGQMPTRSLVPLEQALTNPGTDEQNVFALFAEMKRLAIDNKLGGDRLLQYRLYKQFLSSPESCRLSVAKRLRAGEQASEADGSVCFWCGLMVGLPSVVN